MSCLLLSHDVSHGNGLLYPINRSFNQVYEQKTKNKNETCGDRCPELEQHWILRSASFFVAAIFHYSKTSSPSSQALSCQVQNIVKHIANTIYMLQVRFWCHMSYSLSAAASQCSSWRRHWASSLVKGESPAGGKCAHFLRVMGQTA